MIRLTWTHWTQLNFTLEGGGEAKRAHSQLNTCLIQQLFPFLVIFWVTGGGGVIILLN